MQLATVALLVEAAQMDAEFGAEERAKIADLVSSRFGLAAAESRALLQAADEKVEQSVEFFGFTREIKNAFSPEERIEKILGQYSGGDVTVACWEPGQVSSDHAHPEAVEIYMCLQGGGIMRTDTGTEQIVPDDIKWVIHVPV